MMEPVKSESRFNRVFDGILEAYGKLGFEIAKLSDLQEKDVNGSNEMFITNAREALFRLNQLSFGIYEAVRSGLCQLKRLVPQPSSSPGHALDVSKVELRGDEMVEYFQIMLEAKLFSASCRYLELNHVLRLATIRIAKILHYFIIMQATNMYETEEKFRKICTVLLSKTTNPNQKASWEHILLSLWNNIRGIRKEIGVTDIKEGAIMDHSYLGCKYFRDKMNRCLAAYKVIAQRHEKADGKPEFSNPQMQAQRLLTPSTPSVNGGGKVEIKQTLPQSQIKIAGNNGVYRKVLIYQTVPPVVKVETPSPRNPNQMQFYAADGSEQQVNGRKMPNIEITRLPMPTNHVSNQIVTGRIPPQFAQQIQRVPSNIYFTTQAIPATQVQQMMTSTGPHPSVSQKGKRKRPAPAAKGESTRRNPPKTPKTSSAKNNQSIKPTTPKNSKSKSKSTVSNQGSPAEQGNGDRPSLVLVSHVGKTQHPNLSAVATNGMETTVNNDLNAAGTQTIPPIAVQQTSTVDAPPSEEEIEEFKQWLGIF